ncbi:hypothetical protein [Massilia horti]|uniref:hypothetical protein n=1 Tax=Massilia horti TaxID=2562153 RepID=UPI0014322378|nr:hypothetical protein [Massilia horti]
MLRSLGCGLAIALIDAEENPGPHELIALATFNTPGRHSNIAGCLQTCDHF